MGKKEDHRLAVLDDAEAVLDQARSSHKALAKQIDKVRKKVKRGALPPDDYVLLLRDALSLAQKLSGHVGRVREQLAKSLDEEAHR